MNTALLAPFISTALSGVGVYTYYHFKKYQASKDQCQKVHRMMEDTLLGTSRLFSVSVPTQALKSELRNKLQQLSQEARDTLSVKASATGTTSCFETCSVVVTLSRFASGR